MDRRVAWSESAWTDLESAADYIEKDSPRYAAAFVREMRDASRSLAKLSKRVVILGLIHGIRNLQLLWDSGARE